MSAARDVLKQKVAKARVSRSPISQLGNIGDAFVKALDDRLRILLTTITSSMVMDCEVRKLSSVLEEIPVPAMLAMVNVDRSKNKALINISNDLLFHIVDLRLGGDPSAVPVPTARSITEIDCALCSDFIQCMLDSFIEAFSTVLEVPMTSKMSLAAFEQHATLLTIAPDNADVLVLSAALDLGEAARSGDFDLIIPLSILDIFKSSMKAAAPVKAEKRSPSLWQQHMSTVAADTPARLYSVLHRLPMNVADLEELVPGQMIELPSSCRSSVALTLDGTAQSDTIAVGQLGAFGGSKAVKLSDPPDAAFQDRLRSVIIAEKDQ